jgi:hypothetical protein
MQHSRFEEPVTVLVGMGLPARIETVMEAYALLHDWPAASRTALMPLRSMPARRALPAR